MIHFDFDERYQDELVVGHAISRREGVIFSVLIHGGLFVLLLLLPAFPLFAPSAEEALAIDQNRETERMVFVQPFVDVPAPEPRERAELSDLDRRSQAPQVAEVPGNPLPFSLGNSAERAEAAEQPEERARGPEAPDPPERAEAPPPPQPEMEIARANPPLETGLQRPPVDDVRPTLEPPRPGGSLGEALRNFQQYVDNQTFDNPSGGALDPGQTIQFDTKGVDFGPWLRRFVAQVRRNWFIPHAAMTFRGRVVLQFNIHRDGSITDLVVFQPSDIDAFNRAAFNAIRGSNPTEPLPPEYPDPTAFFTVSFYYNEQPPGQLP